MYKMGQIADVYLAKPTNRLLLPLGFLAQLTPLFSNV